MSCKVMVLNQHKKLTLENVSTILDRDFMWQICLEVLEGSKNFISANESLQNYCIKHGLDYNYYLDLRREILHRTNPNLLTITDLNVVMLAPTADSYELNVNALSRHLIAAYLKPQGYQKDKEKLLRYLRAAVTAALSSSQRRTEEALRKGYF